MNSSLYVVEHYYVFIWKDIISAMDTSGVNKVLESQKKTTTRLITLPGSIAMSSGTCMPSVLEGDDMKWAS